MKSVIQTEKVCYLCGKCQEYGPNRLEEHHIFEGNPDRKNSEKYGLKVYLCGDKCHRNGRESAHQCGETMQQLHEDGQRAFEEHHGSRAEFMRIFGRNYL